MAAAAHGHCAAPKPAPAPPTTPEAPTAAAAPPAATPGTTCPPAPGPGPAAGTGDARPDASAAPFPAAGPSADAAAAADGGLGPAAPAAALQYTAPTEQQPVWTVLRPHEGRSNFTVDLEGSFSKVRGRTAPVPQALAVQQHPLSRAGSVLSCRMSVFNLHFLPVFPNPV
ncbi:mucin-1-like [Python bivittatus]|uniref:Mucin-1-like n=1 Tax=Python bivittatus TaxID=176946 RepID=A0A9F3QR99_PYTBI|nr:mucin-1-like [Python bivittatus]